MARSFAGALAIVLVAASVVPTAAAAPADSTAATVEAAATAPAASSGSRATATGDSAAIGTRLALDEIRKQGVGSLEDALRGRRAALLLAAPRSGPLSAPALLPDAGTRIRPWPLGILAERSTDRTVIAGFPLSLAIPDLAVAWDDPEGDGFEIQEWRTIDASAAPGSFRTAGALLATPRAEAFHDFAMPGASRVSNRARSALAYRKGDGGALDTGARFASPLLARGLAFSYARHASDGIFPLRSHLSTRYDAAAGLPRVGPLSFWLEGARFRRTIEVDIPFGYAANQGATIARGEWSSEEIALRGRGSGDLLRGEGFLRLGRAARTQVSYGGGRERWRSPEAAVSASVERGAAGTRGWTWNGSVDAASRQVEYRVDSIPAFDPRFESIRVAAGGERPLFSGVRVAIAGAFDARERDRSFVEGRVSLWGTGQKGSARIDFESAHERPSWVDRLTPPRDSLVLGPSGETVRLFRSGDPSLRARALRGALGTGTLRVARGVSLVGSGALRRVTDDFGWDASRTEWPDSVVIRDVARARGDGWVSFAALGARLDRSWVRLRGMGWIRGGPGALSPNAGSPPRRGMDAAAAIRASLFGGDLPLELGAEAHALGPRRGLIRAPATVTWDGSLRADFASAAVYFQLSNVFDRKNPSALYEISTDAAVLLPRREFHFGIVWYLTD